MNRHSNDTPVCCQDVDQSLCLSYDPPRFVFTNAGFTIFRWPGQHRLHPDQRQPLSAGANETVWDGCRRWN